MYNDFIVKVYRYGESSNGSRVWDGWYYSKVYAIDGDEFLVYDNGDMSAYNGEEDFCETGFNWVDFTATMDRCGESGRQPMVEPLVPFDIVEFMADRKTENCSEKPNFCEYAENPSGDVWECGCFLDTYCEHQIYDRNPDGTINIVECGYEPKDEPTISKMEQVDEPQTERSE